MLIPGRVMENERKAMEFGVKENLEECGWGSGGQVGGKKGTG
jgi:hypothetical protein